MVAVAWCASRCEDRAANGGFHCRCPSLVRQRLNFAGALPTIRLPIVNPDSVDQFKGTTIVSVRRGTDVVLGGDGQVSMGNTIVKSKAVKVRRLRNDAVLAGFAGGTADAFTLFERFEGALEKYHGNLKRAAVELAKDWRSDRVLRRLEALLAVADRDSSLIVTGNGDVIEPEDGLIAIGSGGPFAQAAARAMLNETALSAKDIAAKSLEIAAEICIYTNRHTTIETL